MLGIGREVATTIDRAAVLDPDRAGGALADAAPALDGDEATLANLAARSTVVQIGLEIDADPTAVGQSALTGRSVGLCRRAARTASRNGHRRQERQRLPA